MALSYRLEPCDGCRKEKHQNVPPQMKWLRVPGQSPKPINCCKECAAEVDRQNKPFEDAEREADEKAAAIMQEKLNAKQAEEEAKKAQEKNLLEMLAQQNQAMVQQNQAILTVLTQLVEQNKPAESDGRPVRGRRKR